MVGSIKGTVYMEKKKGSKYVKTIKKITSDKLWTGQTQIFVKIQKKIVKILFIRES